MNGIGSGIRRTATIFGRELHSLFLSPIAYIILFLFLLVNWISFRYLLGFSMGDLGLLLNVQYSHMHFWILVLIVPPLLTMRSLSEEFRTGTYDQIVTTGTGEGSVVFGKYLASWCYFLFLWLVLLPPYFLLESAGGLDWSLIGSVHLGLLLFGSLLASIGIFASSLTQNSLLAAMIALALNLGVLFLNSFQFVAEPGSHAQRWFQYANPIGHFREDFTQGILDLRYVTLYVSATLFFLFLAAKSLERRRWW